MNVIAQILRMEVQSWTTVNATNLVQEEMLLDAGK
jgi:hypothetical protein